MEVNIWSLFPIDGLLQNGISSMYQRMLVEVISSNREKSITILKWILDQTIIGKSSSTDALDNSLICMATGISSGLVLLALVGLVHQGLVHLGYMLWSIC